MRAVVLRDALRHPSGVTAAVADREWALDAPGSFLPWLTSLWRNLRSLVANATATKEERELLHLIESAASRLGDVLLAASDLDDLDDRLEALLGQPEVFRWNALITQVGLAALQRETPPADELAAAAAPALGAAQARALNAAEPLLDAYFRTLHALASQVGPDVALHAAEMLGAAGPEILRSPEVPPEAASAIRGALRAALCILAVARAIERAGEVAIPTWLAQGLVERLVAGVRSHLRLLASLPGVNVADSVLPIDERLDLARIEERHRLARAEAQRTYEIARRRLVPDA